MSRRPDITREEAGWIVLARSFDPDLHAAFIAAAEAIAAGRKPTPYEPKGNRHA